MNSTKDSGQRRALLPPEIEELGSECLITIPARGMTILGDRTHNHPQKVAQPLLTPPSPMSRLDTAERLAIIRLAS
jgi:hypothetical protein